MPGQTYLNILRNERPVSDGSDMSDAEATTLSRKLFSMLVDGPQKRGRLEAQRVHRWMYYG